VELWLVVVVVMMIVPRSTNSVSAIAACMNVLHPLEGVSFRILHARVVDLEVQFPVIFICIRTHYSNPIRLNAPGLAGPSDVHRKYSTAGVPARFPTEPPPPIATRERLRVLASRST